MARVQYGVVVTALKGNIGGQTFQSGNGGAILRNKGYRKGSVTVAKNSANVALTWITTSWRSLTDEQRSAWTAAAASWPFTDKFGNVYYSNGYQCFVSYNRNLTGIGEPAVLVPAVSSSAFNYGIISAVAYDDGSLIISSQYVSDQVQSLVISATVQRSQGRNANNPKLVKLVSVPMLGVSTWDVGAYYISQFGQLSLGGAIVIETVCRLVDYPYDVFRQRIRVIVTAPVVGGIGFMDVGGTFVVS